MRVAADQGDRETRNEEFIDSHEASRNAATGSCHSVVTADSQPCGPSPGESVDGQPLREHKV